MTHKKNLSEINLPAMLKEMNLEKKNSQFSFYSS